MIRELEREMLTPLSMSPQICFRFRKGNNTKIFGKKWNPCVFVDRNGKRIKSIAIRINTRFNPMMESDILLWAQCQIFLRSIKDHIMMERPDWNHIANLNKYNQDVWILDWIIFPQKLKGAKCHDNYRIRVLMYIIFKKVLNVRIDEIPVTIKGTVNLSL